jgi:hypothetical protein
MIRQDYYKCILTLVNGTPDRDRTCDLQLRRLPLYPTELPGHIFGDIRGVIPTSELFYYDCASAA